MLGGLVRGLGKAGSRAFNAARRSGGNPGWMNVSDAATVFGTALGAINPFVGLGLVGTSRAIKHGGKALSTKLGNKVPASRFSDPFYIKSPVLRKDISPSPGKDWADQWAKKGVDAIPGWNARSQPGYNINIRNQLQQGWTPKPYNGLPAVAEYPYSFTRAFKNTGKLLRNEDVSVFGRLDEIAGGSRWQRTAALLGTSGGAATRVAMEGVGQLGKAAGSVAGSAWRHKVPILNVAALGTAGIGMMALQSYNGNPLSLHTYSGSPFDNSPRGQDPLFLQNQMQAIAENEMYNSSEQAGMGSPLSFSRSSYSGPIPILPAFQKHAGYSPQALGATGDLVFALNSLRRQ